MIMIFQKQRPSSSLLLFICVTFCLLASFSTVNAQTTSIDENWDVFTTLRRDNPTLTDCTQPVKNEINRRVKQSMYDATCGAYDHEELEYENELDDEQRRDRNLRHDNMNDDSSSQAHRELGCAENYNCGTSSNCVACCTYRCLSTYNTCIRSGSSCPGRRRLEQDINFEREMRRLSVEFDENEMERLCMISLKEYADLSESGNCLGTTALIQCHMAILVPSTEDGCP